ncbi:cobalamin biosynthesis protein [Streptomyces sp. M19]
MPHPSAAPLAATGTPSVAEAAALLAAGPGAQLLVPKRKSAPASGMPSATCAVARCDAPTTNGGVTGRTGNSRGATRPPPGRRRHHTATAGGTDARLTRSHRARRRPPVAREVVRRAVACRSAARRPATGRPVIRRSPPGPPGRVQGPVASGHREKSRRGRARRRRRHQGLRCPAHLTRQCRGGVRRKRPGRRGCSAGLVGARRRPRPPGGGPTALSNVSGSGPKPDPYNRGPGRGRSPRARRRPPVPTRPHRPRSAGPDPSTPPPRPKPREDRRVPTPS